MSFIDVPITCCVECHKTLGKKDGYFHCFYCGIRHEKIEDEPKTIQEQIRDVNEAEGIRIAKQVCQNIIDGVCESKDAIISNKTTFYYYIAHNLAAHSTSGMTIDEQWEKYRKEKGIE